MEEFLVARVYLRKRINQFSQLTGISILIDALLLSISRISIFFVNAYFPYSILNFQIRVAKKEISNKRKQIFIENKTNLHSIIEWVESFCL